MIYDLLLKSGQVFSNQVNQGFLSYFDDHCYNLFEHLMSDSTVSVYPCLLRLKAENQLYLYFKYLTENDVTPEVIIKLRSDAHDRFGKLDADFKVDLIPVAEPAKLAKFYESYAKRLELKLKFETAWHFSSLQAAVQHGNIKYFIDVARTIYLERKTEE